MRTKHILLILLLLPSIAIAQSRNNIYIDAGITSLGLSATYDRTIAKRLDVGAGLHYYDFNQTYYNQRAAAFADIRPHWQTRHSLFFIYLDAGIGITGGRLAAQTTLANPGLYIGLGLGYCYKINNRGMGPYISLGLDGNMVHTVSSDPLLAPPARDYRVFDAFSIISLGFKL